MAEILHRFDATVKTPQGATYRAQACGRKRDDGLWEGWIEFLPMAGGEPLRTERETTQPNRADALYWSEGLGPAYLEGALERALQVPVSRSEPSSEGPVFTGPAPTAPARARARAILDPFSVGAKGKDLLRRELSALEAWHLRNIVRGYGLADEHRVDLETLGRDELVALIVAEVDSRSRVTASEGHAGRTISTPRH
jgi:hypothetical protein